MPTSFDLIINTSGGPQPLAFAVPARHEDHERIIAALQRADPEGARAEMETHILGTVAVIQPSAGTRLKADPGCG